MKKLLLSLLLLLVTSKGFTQADTCLVKDSINAERIVDMFTSLMNFYVTIPLTTDCQFDKKKNCISDQFTQLITVFYTRRTGEPCYPIAYTPRGGAYSSLENFCYNNNYSKTFLSVDTLERKKFFVIAYDEIESPTGGSIFVNVMQCQNREYVDEMPHYMDFVVAFLANTTIHSDVSAKSLDSFLASTDTIVQDDQDSSAWRVKLVKDSYTSKLTFAKDSTQVYEYCITVDTTGFIIKKTFSWHLRPHYKVPAIYTTHYYDGGFKTYFYDRDRNLILNGIHFLKKEF